MVPAVVYGHKKESAALSVNAHDFIKLFKEAGYTTLVNLKIDDSRSVKALIHEVQFHPVRSEVIHIDFYTVNLKEKLKTTIPLEFVGVADAVDVLGGILMTVKDEVEVECLPDDLVQEITVDLTALKTLEDDIRVSSLVAPAGITILDDADDLIVSITQPRSEEEMAELEAPVDTTLDVEVETGKDADATEEAAPEEK